MEANSRPERLASFKRASGDSTENARLPLRKFCPDMSEDDRTRVIYAFFPFMFGVRSYTSVTAKREAAPKKAGADFVRPTACGLVRACLARLPGGARELSRDAVE